MRKRHLVPREVRRNEPILAYEVQQIREAFLADEPIRRIAHRFGIDAGSIYYHCQDLLDRRPPRKRGRPKS